MGKSGSLLCLFLSFPNDTIQILIDKSIDVVLGTRTWGGKMEGTDYYTELWRHPNIGPVVSKAKVFLPRYNKFGVRI